MVARLLSCAALVALWMALLGGSCAWAQRTGEFQSPPAPWREARRLWGEIEADSTHPFTILRLAALELSIGRPEKAGELLGRDSDSSWPGEVVDPLLGAVEYQPEHFERGPRD